MSTNLPPTHPGETLLEMLQHCEWSQTKLAKKMGRPIKTINEIIKGKTRITEETALDLEKALGINAETWLTLEQNYRLHLARQARS